jgi:ornithine decarboxylase
MDLTSWAHFGDTSGLSTPTPLAPSICSAEDMIKCEEQPSDKGILSSSPAHIIGSAEDKTILSCSSSTSGDCSDHSTSDSCSDHSDCDSWGPAAYEESGALDDLLQDDDVRKMPADYAIEQLVHELAVGSASENAFYVVDLSVVMGKLCAWKKALPRVKPLYAIKCNPDQKMCRMLAGAGVGFDCASQAEIEFALNLGTHPDHLIYANPCKQANMLRYARKVGVRKMTADNVEELYKIRDLFPEARVVLRIAVDDSKSVCRFNSKFGSPPKEWDAMMKKAKELGLDLHGISFHVGSGCGDLKPFADAVSAARDAFDLAESYGFSPTLLDIGGGWPGDDDGSFSFKDVAAVVSDAIDHYFPASSGVDIIAEPGRYFAKTSHTYAVTVIAKRQLSAAQLADTAEIESFGARPTKDSEDSISSSQHDDGFKKSEATDKTPEVALYLNDGVYGSFNCVVFDHAEVCPKPLLRRGGAGSRTVATKLFGPTCDSIDVVMPCTRLPEMQVGEWIWFQGMGAYTRCAASRFNGQGAHDVHYIWAGMP